jgi:hypothetical protein
LLYCHRFIEQTTVVVVRIPPGPERIRELCAQAATANEPELAEILSELREALREHARFVRRMATETLKRASVSSPD